MASGRCGTASGYARHLREGTTPCLRCGEAADLTGPGEDVVLRLKADLVAAMDAHARSKGLTRSQFVGEILARVFPKWSNAERAGAR